MKFAIFDLDHTIAHSHWRDVMKPPNNSWDEYHLASLNDEPNEDMVSLIKHLTVANYNCLGMTRRPEKFRQNTNQWMMRHSVHLTHYFMAADKESRSISEVKLAMLEDHFTEVQRKDISFYIDDDPETCAAITDKFGIMTFNVRFRARF